MKIIVLISVLFFCGVALIGCSPELVAGGAGFGGGLAASETLKGMQADLARREAALVARYNELVEAGARAETLEDMEQQIADLRTAQQGTETIRQTDWTDPAAVGGGLGTLVALAYGFIKRKELKNTVAGVKQFRARADETVKHQLDQVMIESGANT